MKIANFTNYRITNNFNNDQIKWQDSVHNA